MSEGPGSWLRRLLEPQSKKETAALIGASILPGIGEAIDVGDIALGLKDRDPWRVGFGGLGLALPFVAGSTIRRALGKGDDIARAAGKSDDVAQAVTRTAEPEQGIRAFHGSPHDFDKFSMDALRTGEGSNAFGRGLYFAENEGVAKYYRDLLGKPSPRRLLPDNKLPDYFKPGNIVPSYGGGYDRVLEFHPSTAERGWHVVVQAVKKNAAGEWVPDPNDMRVRSHFTHPDMQKAAEVLGELDTGRMYEVNIRARPEDLLDYDAPLSQQAPGVRSRLSPLEADPKWSGGRLFGDDTGADVLDLLGEDRLKELGIPGHRYFDAGSRGAKEGTRNYVMWDESLIDIVRKYGLAALLGGGLAARASGDRRSGG
jgi:hypothetical protein